MNNEKNRSKYRYIKINWRGFLESVKKNENQQ